MDEIFHLFVFFVNGHLDSVCEGVSNAESGEKYLQSRGFNQVEVTSIIADSWESAWDVVDSILEAHHA